MTRLLIDTSVLVKWFHTEGEAEATEARALRDAHRAGELTAHAIDLAYYELGNVLARGLRWAPGTVADQLDDLLVILGAPIAMAPAWWRAAASLAAQHELSFYDACWAATAGALDMPLVSADARLVGAGLASSPRDVAVRLGLAD